MKNMTLRAGEPVEDDFQKHLWREPTGGLDGWKERGLLNINVL